MTNEIEKQWSQLMARMAEPDKSLVDELESIQSDLQAELFGGRPDPGREYVPDERSLAILLDALDALALLEPGDPSYPWDRALVLKAVGRHLDAAHAYVEAANRFARAPGLTGDEADWAADARRLAAECFDAAGSRASAAAVKGSVLE